MEQQRYVGIDFHRRRPVIVHKNAAGEILETVHLENDPAGFARELAKAGEQPEVVLTSKPVRGCRGCSRRSRLAFV